MRRVVSVLGVTALVLAGGLAGAEVTPPPPGECDFVTGGGFIIRDSGFKANFGVGGGCKKNGPDAPFWGHLNYIDHETGLHVHGTSVTGYFITGDTTRDICGEATTNQVGPVSYRVTVDDQGEPGVNDRFIIRLSSGYTTESDSNNTLGGDGPGGGNIQLHKSNPSTAGSPGGSCFDDVVE